MLKVYDKCALIKIHDQPPLIRTHVTWNNILYSGLNIKFMGCLAHLNVLVIEAAFHAIHTHCLLLFII